MFPGRHRPRLLRTRAEAQADGSYAISGSKIFISGGEQDLTENIVHLVLARLADAPAGVMGISPVPGAEVLVANPDGSLGDAKVLGVRRHRAQDGDQGRFHLRDELRRRQGQAAGPGEPGSACMFTMMNDARFQVGLQAWVSPAAFQGALGYARDACSRAPWSACRMGQGR